MVVMRHSWMISWRRPLGAIMLGPWLRPALEIPALRIAVVTILADSHGRERLRPRQLLQREFEACVSAGWPNRPKAR